MSASNCSQQADQIKDFSLKDFPSQQHTAVEPKKSEEVNEENFDQQVGATHFVEEIKLVDSTNQTDTHKDKFPAAETAVSKSSQAVLTESAQVTCYEDELEADDYSASEPVEKSVQPSHQEVIDVLQQLREIPCTPQFRLNAEIQRTVKRYITLYNLNVTICK